MSQIYEVMLHNRPFLTMSQIYEVMLHWKQCVNSTSSSVLKADMKSYKPLDTAAIFFLANLFLKQGTSSEYVMVDCICMGKLGLQGAKNRELQNEKFLPIARLELTAPDSQV